MANRSDFRRRLLGAIFLGAALGMLVAGQTVLQHRLGPVGFTVFWLVCFLFTFLAILVAAWDLAVVRHRTREEHRALFESTLNEIARQKQAKAQSKPGQAGETK